MRPLLLLLLVALCLPALADPRMQRLGNLQVHYSAFNANYLQTRVAQANGLQRSGQLGVLTLSVLAAGKSTPVQVSGEVKTVLGHTQALRFIEQHEGAFVSYLAQFPLTSRELLLFNLQVNGQHLNFHQELFPEP